MINKISVTNNSYNIQIEVKILDDTSSRITTVNQAALVGENKYYSVFNDEILNTIDENPNHEYLLKKQDYIVVTISNTNYTFGAQIRGFLFKLLGKDSEVIVAKASAEIQ